MEKNIRVVLNNDDAFGGEVIKGSADVDALYEADFVTFKTKTLEGKPVNRRVPIQNVRYIDVEE